MVVSNALAAVADALEISLDQLRKEVNEDGSKSTN